MFGLALLEVGVSILLAAAGVLAALHRWIARLNHRLDKQDIHTKTLCSDMAEMKRLNRRQAALLDKMAKVIMLELSKNDGKSTRDRVAHTERLVKLLAQDE